MPNLFLPGDAVVATPAFLAMAQREGINPDTYLARHLSGDWGDVTEEDKGENEFALSRNLRIVSVYNTPDNGTRFWIITEADRSSTTLLLPSDY
jgi:hypothetical protein